MGALAKPAKVIITPRLRALLWQRYADNPPREGHEYYNWVEEQAEQLGVSADMVQRIIADQAHSVELAIRQQNNSVGQTIANMMGATLVEAYAAIMRGLQATDRKYFRDRQGNPLLQCPECGEVTKGKCEKCGVKGEPMFAEQPLFDVQVRSGKEMLKVHGAYAPQQIEVTKNVLHHELSDEALLAHVRDLSRSIEGQLAQAGSGTRGGQLGTADQACIEGQVLLADGTDGDGGRAGSGEPEQAVPEEMLHPASSRVAE